MVVQTLFLRSAKNLIQVRHVVLLLVKQLHLVMQRHHSVQHAIVVMIHLHMLVMIVAPQRLIQM